MFPMTPDKALLIVLGLSFPLTLIGLFLALFLRRHRMSEKSEEERGHDLGIGKDRVEG